MSVQDLEAALLKLPNQERARLAEVLIESLDDENEIAQAWTAEAERRLEELRSGTVQGVQEEDVFARIRARIQ